MTILVTGGGGLVGIKLAEELIGRGKRIVLFDRHGLPEPALRLLRERDPALEVVAGDVRDSAALGQAFTDFEVRSVIHTAAVTADAAREAREPGAIVDVNVLGTVRVLQAARSAGCERVVHVSSGAAYGKTHSEEQVLFEELSPSRPEDIYGISKFAAEQSALRLAGLWGLRVTCVRLGSVCGPWEFATGVRDLLSAQLQVVQLALRAQEAVLPAQEAWRDWIYSRDVAAGLADVLEAHTPAHGLYHLSSGIDWRGSFGYLCSTLQQAYPGFSWRIAAPGEQPNVSFVVEHDRARMDIRRMVHDIGFS